MDLYQALQQVDSRDAFLRFLSLLHQDWEASQAAEISRPSSPYGPAALGWENTKLGTFLEAMQAWGTDMNDRLPMDPTWRTFAEMLVAAKVYE